METIVPHPEAISISEEVVSLLGGIEKLRTDLALELRKTIDQVIDAPRTGRTKFGELDRVEKTFFGLKVEHCFRALLGVPSGKRDLVVANQDVDIKCTTANNWMIPIESVRDHDVCALFKIDVDSSKYSLGFIKIEDSVLTRGSNRDGKRSISKEGRAAILWLAEDADVEPSRWDEINVDKYLELRLIDPGAMRAALFFESHLNIVIHRSVIVALLHDQKDPLKRLRQNGGARDILKGRSFLLLSGMYDVKQASEYGFDGLGPDEFVCTKLNISLSTPLPDVDLSNP